MKLRAEDERSEGEPSTSLCSTPGTLYVRGLVALRWRAGSLVDVDRGRSPGSRSPSRRSRFRHSVPASSAVAGCGSYLLRTCRLIGMRSCTRQYGALTAVRYVAFFRSKIFHKFLLRSGIRVVGTYSIETKSTRRSRRRRSESESESRNSYRVVNLSDFGRIQSRYEKRETRGVASPEPLQRGVGGLNSIMKIIY